MIIDISSYNGKIDFEEMKKNADVERIIMRATTKNGELDVRLLENINGAIQHGFKNIDLYKFSYARDFVSACVECTVLISKLREKGLFTLIDVLWLDVEKFGGRDYTTDELSQVITAYDIICRLNGVYFGIYCNYSYLKNLIPKWAYKYEFWVARWNNTLGDTFGANVVYWQHSNGGKVAGITTDVDLSRRVML